MVDVGCLMSDFGCMGDWGIGWSIHKNVISTESAAAEKWRYLLTIEKYLKMGKSGIVLIVGGFLDFATLGMTVLPSSG